LLDGDKRFIAEKYSIHYVASGRDLLRELKSASDSSPAIVFAAPDFNLNSSPTVGDGTSETSVGVMRGREKTVMEDLTFGPLEGTETERAKLTWIFVDWRSETISLAGQDATKEALFRIHSPYILHLARTDSSHRKISPTQVQLSYSRLACRRAYLSHSSLTIRCTAVVWPWPEHKPRCKHGKKEMPP
jgi:hypothetical protein